MLQPRSDLDVAITQLGRICPRGHDYQNTGKSLRYSKSGRCVECCRLQWRNPQEFKKTRNQTRSGLHLGKLCSRGHDYQNTGKSLRAGKNKACVECERIYRRRTRDRAKGILVAVEIPAPDLTQEEVAAAELWERMEPDYPAEDFTHEEWGELYLGPRCSKPEHIYRYVDADGHRRVSAGTRRRCESDSCVECLIANQKRAIANREAKKLARQKAQENQ